MFCTGPELKLPAQFKKLDFMACGIGENNSKKKGQIIQ